MKTKMKPFVGFVLFGCGISLSGCPAIVNDDSDSDSYDDPTGDTASDTASDTAPDTAPDTDASPVDTQGACSGRPGALSGKTQQSLTAGGIDRTFVYYAPAGLDPNTPTPLVIVPHGFTMSGEAMYDVTAYHEIADKEGFVVAYPDGALGLGPWNVGENICGSGALVVGANDDQAFIDEIINFVDRDRCLDNDHIFVTGFSMGGYFSNEVGCLRSDIAAIGPHSGGSHPLTACTGDIKPVIIFHFRDDILISYDCGTEAAGRWVERNGCNPDSPEVRTVEGGVCEYFKGCPAKAQVALCSFDIPADGGGTLLAGHGWAGGASNPYSVVGTASASEIGWQFFKEFAW